MNVSLDALVERVLILRCQVGDAAAFAELVGRHSLRVGNFLKRLLDDPHLADDALQEVWVDAYRSIGKLQEPGAFPAWLFRIARDRAYRLLRRRGLKTRSLEGDEFPGPLPESEADADERELLNVSLESLPYEQREVVLLRFVEQMPYEQIAETVGCGIGTVRSRLHYAKRALRRRMERSKDHE